MLIINIIDSKIANMINMINIRSFCIFLLLSFLTPLNLKLYIVDECFFYSQKFTIVPN